MSGESPLPGTASAADPPLVSVVIPTWNRAELLRGAIASALSQTLTDIEIFVSDNGSTDHTAEVVASFPDPRLHYRPLPQNVGLHGNLNRCLGFGTAPYVAFLHDDDRYRPDNLVRKVRFLEEQPTVGAVHSAVDRADLDGRIIERDVVFGGGSPAGVEAGRAFIARSMAQRGLTEFTSTVLRRDAIAGCRFDARDGLLCDVGFRIRMALTSELGFIPEALTVQTKHTGSLTTGGLIPDGASEYQTLASVAHIATLAEVRTRFLSEHADQLHEVELLRRLARRSTRRELAEAVDVSTWPERQLRATLRAVSEAVTVDPWVLAEGPALRAVAAALAGARTRDRVRRAIHGRA